MAKVYNYLIMMAGIILVLNYFGIRTPTAAMLGIFDINNPGAFALSSFFTFSIAALTTLIIAGIVVGVYFRQSPESFILIGYTITLFAFILDFIAIIIALNAYALWIQGIAILIIGPLVIGYVHAVISWWGNKQ